jgi:hypothetical protein
VLFISKLSALAHEGGLASGIQQRFNSFASSIGRSYEKVMEDVIFGEGPVSLLLFDDAQDTYWDEMLWAGLFKEVMGYGPRSKVRIICFASYEGPSYRNCPHRHGIPQKISAAASVGLLPTDSVNHGLLFTKAEFDEFMKLRDELVRQELDFASGWTILDDDLKDYIFKSTNGHIGAITGLLNIAAIAAASVLCCSFILPLSRLIML